MLLLLTLSACAVADPYSRLDPAPTPELSAVAANAAFEGRWPEQFKCVQTVTIDFRVQTRTLVGYLIVQRPAKFRLQGMTEQGLTLFDVAYDDGKSTRVSAAEEFDGKVIDDIVRDIRRTFLDFSIPRDDTDPAVRGAHSVGVDRRDNGTRFTLRGRGMDLVANAVGDPPRIDWYAGRQSDRDLYRVDQYEWQKFGELLLPSVIVLRESGIQSDGPPYKLTMKITEFTPRDKPWPVALFAPKEGG